MDKDQEKLEYLGFFGILKESLNIILSHTKIFTKISFTFILPLTFIVLANNEISKFFLNKFINNLSPNNNDASTLPPSKWVLYWIFAATTYFTLIFDIIFTLLSFSAVTYTAACIYAKKEITFKEVMTAVPRVWKRLLITLFSNFCITSTYTIVTIICWIVITRVIFTYTPQGSTIASIIIAILYLTGLIYLAIFWQLANAISVMENYSGFKAMNKSKQLIKGKIGTAIALLLMSLIFHTPILLLNQQLAKSDNNISIASKILCMILILLLNPLFTLYGLVVQTTFYCVCKSYHHENIDKSTLTNHLEGFIGDSYVPLLTEAVEIV